MERELFREFIHYSESYTLLFFLQRRTSRCLEYIVAGASNSFVIHSIMYYCLHSMRHVVCTLLQLFDDGHLTDSHGRKVDFRNIIVVMTSNIGANVIAELPSNLTGSEPAVQETLMEVVRGTLSPELLKCVIV